MLRHYSDAVRHSVLFCYTSLPQGGLAFDVRSLYPPYLPQILTLPDQATQIGYALSISGCVSIFLQLFCMPYLLRRFDNARMYNFCMGLWPFCFVLLPGLNLLACLGATDPVTGALDPATKTLVWMGICVILTISRAAALAFS